MARKATRKTVTAACAKVKKKRNQKKERFPTSAVRGYGTFAFFLRFRFIHSARLPTARPALKFSNKRGCELEFFFPSAFSSSAAGALGYTRSAPGNNRTRRYAYTNREIFFAIFLLFFFFLHFVFSIQSGNRSGYKFVVPLSNNCFSPLWIYDSPLIYNEMEIPFRPSRPHPSPPPIRPRHNLPTPTPAVWAANWLSFLLQKMKILPYRDVIKRVYANGN